MCSSSHGKERVPCSMPSGARWLPASGGKAELRDRHKLERAAIRRDRGPFPSCKEWLSRLDHDHAQEWRYRERRPPTIEGPKFEPPAPRDIRAFSAVVDGSRVHYHSTGSRGAPAFTDRGRTIDIYDTGRRESVLAALQLSAQKWGTITVRGNEQFRRTCVELAADTASKSRTRIFSRPSRPNANASVPGNRTPWSGSRVDDQRP